MDNRVLLHQVHTLKLAADISGSVLSDVFLWQRRLLPGIVVRLALPIAGSGVVLSLADVERLRATRRGQYVLENMTPGATAVRLAGDIVMAVGAWQRKPVLISLGLLVVMAGWSKGLLIGLNGRDVVGPGARRHA